MATTKVDIDKLKAELQEARESVAAVGVLSVEEIDKLKVEVDGAKKACAATTTEQVQASFDGISSNRNGAMSQEELKGGIEAFDTIYGNHDGSLSVEEFKAATKAKIRKLKSELHLQSTKHEELPNERKDFHRNEIDMLKAEAGYLQKSLDTIIRRIEELGKKPAEKS